MSKSAWIPARLPTKGASVRSGEATLCNSRARRFVMVPAKTRENDRSLQHRTVKVVFTSM